jgi:hypothetical protein
MTTKTSLYYSIRTAVRFTFWGGLGIFSMLGITRLADIVDPDNDNPCPVVLNANFTWENDGQMFVDIKNCDAPSNATLHQNGTWEWTE